MSLTAQDIRGGAAKYESLPAHEKQAIDRKFDEITREVESHNESRERSADNDLKTLAKEVGTHCYRQIINGGYFQIPTRHGGNEFKEEQVSEEDKKIEAVVRKIVYDLTVEQAVEYLKDKIDTNKI